MKTLLYSFKTFPFLDSFQEEIFTFGKLKEDLLQFKILIEKEKPERIIGFAITKYKSRIETVTINKFSQRKVSKYGKESYDLNYPAEGYKNIIVSTRASDTFCNWTIYKIAEFISKDIELSFIHINSKDIEDLKAYIKVH